MFEPSAPPCDPGLSNEETIAFYEYLKTKGNGDDGFGTPTFASASSYELCFHANQPLRDRSKSVVIGLILPGQSAASFKADKRTKSFKLYLPYDDYVLDSKPLEKFLKQFLRSCSGGGWAIDRRLLPHSDDVKLAAVFCFDRDFNGNNGRRWKERDFSQHIRSTIRPNGQAPPIPPANLIPATTIGASFPRHPPVSYFPYNKALHRTLVTIGDLLEAYPFLRRTDKGIGCYDCTLHGTFTEYCISEGDPEVIFLNRFKTLKASLKKHIEKNHVNEETQREISVLNDCHSAADVTQLSDFKALPGYIICSICFNQVGSKGRFAWSHGNNINVFDKTTREEFSSLKSSLSEHLKSTQHKLRKETPGFSQGECIGNLQEECSLVNLYKAGLAKALNAYKIYKMGHSFKSFEADMLVDSLKGVVTGDAHNSKHFPTQFLNVVYDVVSDVLKSTLLMQVPATGRRRPIAAMFDKGTIQHLTFHFITCLIAHDGALKYYLLAAKEVEDGTAPGLAKQIVETVEAFTGEDASEMLVATSSDGQYHIMGVKQKILDLLGIPEDSFFSFTWDVSHLIELAAAKSRGQSGNANTMTVRWIRELLSLLGSVAQKYKWGKNWKNLREVYQELSEIPVEEPYALDIPKNGPRTFKTWSHTRFATHLHSFLTSFAENFACLMHLSAIKDDELEQLKTTSVLLRLTFLLDFYKLIGEMSRKVQTVELLPWQLYDHVFAYLERMEKMKDVLSNPGSFWPECEDLAELNRCVNEIIANSTYRGVVVQPMDQGNFRRALRSDPQSDALVAMERFEESLDAIRHAMADSISTFVTTLRNSVDENMPEFLRLACPIFRLESVRNRRQGDIPEELSEIFQKFGKYLFNDSVAFDNLIEEFNLFDARIRLALCEIEQDQRLESKFHIQLLEDQNGFPNISQLLITTLTMTHCESVVESVGSVAKNILTGRGSLKPEVFEKLLFVRTNGPSIGEECSELLDYCLKKQYGQVAEWPFFRKSKAEKLIPVKRSRTLDRLNECPQKLNYRKFLK